jgi:hypothetical protein
VSLVILRDCDNCRGAEERLFYDSWTGKELCISCLAPIIDKLAMSPASEEDNLAQLLREDGRA